MFRKLIIRLVLISIGINSVAVLALGVMGYLALQEPAYYAKLRSQSFAQLDEKTLEANFQLIERDLEIWTRRSIERQQVMSNAVPAELPSGAGAYDPLEDVKAVTVTQDQINAMIASSSATKQGDWRNPRIRLEKDQLVFAFEVVAPQFRLVVSAALRPSIVTDGRMRFDLHSAHVGRLRLPVQTVLQWLPLEPSYRDKNLELVLSGTTPHVLVSPPDVGRDSPTIKSIQVDQGKLIVELLPPVIQAEQIVSTAKPVVLSFVD